MNPATQYDAIAKDFSKNHDDSERSNRVNREEFYSYIDFLRPGVKVLDLGCGDGTDMAYYKKRGADIYGLDASEELLEIAAWKCPEAKLTHGFFENLPYDNSSFDVVLSKYALMTPADMQPAFKEIHRVLRPGGILLYLATHPFRQYIEKKDAQADYFKQTNVDSLILNGTVTVHEPSHTMNDYLSNFLFENFDVRAYRESFDPAAEQVDGKKYPGYFILKAVKRK